MIKKYVLLMSFGAMMLISSTAQLSSMTVFHAWYEPLNATSHQKLANHGVTVTNTKLTIPGMINGVNDPAKVLGLEISPPAGSTGLGNVHLRIQLTGATQTWTWGDIGRYGVANCGAGLYVNNNKIDSYNAKYYLFYKLNSVVLTPAEFTLRCNQLKDELASFEVLNIK